LAYATLCSMWTQLPPEKGHTHSTQFLAHVYCGQMAGWMKTPLGTEVDLGAGHIVLDGVPALAKGAQQPPPPYLRRAILIRTSFATEPAGHAQRYGRIRMYVWTRIPHLIYKDTRINCCNLCISRQNNIAVRSFLNNTIIPHSHTIMSKLPTEQTCKCWFRKYLSQYNGCTHLSK